MSGIGKGITISSIGRLLKSSGLSVTSIKIDPYLNVDAGTMSPYEHGETFVLNDGGETDLDLGNYERFLDVNLSARHNITSGKIFNEVSLLMFHFLAFVSIYSIYIYRIGYPQGTPRRLFREDSSNCPSCN